MTVLVKASTPRFLLSGAVAGAASAFAFTALHHLTISDIWFALVPMLVAGAVSGLCLAWTYGLLFGAPTPARWWLYNGLWVVLIVLLGAASFVVYEPVTTLAAVMAAGGAPPPELLRQAMPLTVGYTLGTTVLLSLAWGRSPLKAGSILVTSAVLVTLLGINVSVLGLVELDGSVVPLLAMMVVLIMALILGFAGVFHLLERRRFRPADADGMAATAGGVIRPPASPASRQAGHSGPLRRG
jgi:uncharacterized membrane protein YuzA (DUF378 family)